MITEAILNLLPNAKFHISGNFTYDDIEWQDSRVKPSKADVDVEIIRIQVAYDSQAYARNRKVEYDALNQFELMTDDAANSTTTHADAIEAIKKKYPKG